ncbi:MAG: hypothetical protein M3R38_12400 [Actinomycetota bacterium]|jgi:hypothetical protein|nr:hypothetical protein [Actinomycetota bacterium]MDP9476462.1 hypothetical protein [Actinomycetota bacterium]MDP9488483.1 hypothetical protein [Actinomycetota bacterium]
MEQPKRQTRLTPEEQRLKERLMRSGNPVIRKGAGRVSEEFWKLPKPKDPEGKALRYLLEGRRQGR